MLRQNYACARNLFVIDEAKGRDADTAPPHPGQLGRKTTVAENVAGSM
jgi:hypothetical protein